MDLELPKENYFLTQAKINLRNAQRDLEYQKEDGTNYFYVLDYSIYEQETLGGLFLETSDMICENVLSEERLIELGAVKHYYE